MNLHLKAFVSTLALVLLVNVSLKANVSSLGGPLQYKIADQTFMTLSEIGLGLGTTTPSCNLEVCGNSIITGTLTVGTGVSSSSNLHLCGSLGMGVQVLSSNATLGSSSLILVTPNSTGNIILTPPSPSTCMGRIYTIKQAAFGAYKIHLVYSANIDNDRVYTFPSANTLGCISLISSGAQWHVLGTCGEVSTLNEELTSDGNTLALYHFNEDGRDGGSYYSALGLSGNASYSTENLGWMNVPLGKVLKVNDYTDYASANLSDFIPTVGTDLTFEFRFYVKSYRAYHVAGYSLISIKQNYDTHMEVFQGNNDVNAKFQISTDDAVIDTVSWASNVLTHRWYKFKATYKHSNPEYKAYINDQHVATYTGSGMNASRTSAISLMLGRFEGYIDEVRISNIIR